MYRIGTKQKCKKAAKKLLEKTLNFQTLNFLTIYCSL